MKKWHFCMLINMDIPNTILADIAAHFGLHQSFYYRRVSQNWRLVLAKVFATNHLIVSVTKMQRHKHWTHVANSVFHSYYNDFPAAITEWFVAQTNGPPSRGICTFGLGQTFVGPSDVCDRLVKTIKRCTEEMNCPPKFWLWLNLRLSAWDVLNVHISHRFTDKRMPAPTCRVVLKDCWLTGIDWIRLLPQEQRLMKTLLPIHITEMEHVNIGVLGKGHRHAVANFMAYAYGEGEAEAFSAELLRLGRKYVKPTTGAERHELDTLFHYYYLNQEYLNGFPEIMDEIIQTHEPELVEVGILPHALHNLYENYVTLWKLKPLTERLLLALSFDCHYV